MFAKVHCGSLVGVEAHAVQVEVSLGRGLPGFDIVGLPEAAVREARVRVKAALSHAGFELPPKKIVLNLAPGDLRKTGAGFDLAIALAVLVACERCPAPPIAQTLVLGELSLDGAVRPVRGLLAQLRSAAARGLSAAIVPAGNACEAALAIGMDVRCATHLAELVAYLDGKGSLATPEAIAGSDSTPPTSLEDLADVRGQAAAKRALEIAAAGPHNLLMVGPPGAGKTMLARRLPSLLPCPTPAEALEIATILGAAGLPIARRLHQVARPFRMPHHTASDAALVGGGDPIRPGEVTLAHGGVLFLDELPEFRRSAVEALRPTMESGEAMIVRARQRVRLPARTLIVAAMNPCPSGFACDGRRMCRCTPEQVQRYQARVSGPILDRFDLHVALPPVKLGSIGRKEQAEHSDVVRDRVEAARARARVRETAATTGQATPTSQATPLDTLRAQVSLEGLRLLDRCSERFGLSLRAHVKVLRVARTIADLASADHVEAGHIAEALQYRLLDRAQPTASHESASPFPDAHAPSHNPPT